MVLKAEALDFVVDVRTMSPHLSPQYLGSMATTMATNGSTTQTYLQWLKSFDFEQTSIFVYWHNSVWCELRLSYSSSQFESNGFVSCLPLFWLPRAHANMVIFLLLMSYCVFFLLRRGCSHASRMSMFELVSCMSVLRASAVVYCHKLCGGAL